MEARAPTLQTAHLQLFDMHVIRSTLHIREKNAIMSHMELVLPSAQYKRSFIEAIAEYQQEGGRL